MTRKLAIAIAVAAFLAGAVSVAAVGVTYKTPVWMRGIIVSAPPLNGQLDDWYGGHVFYLNTNTGTVMRLYGRDAMVYIPGEHYNAASNTLETIAP